MKEDSKAEKLCKFHLYDVLGELTNLTSAELMRKYHYLGANEVAGICIASARHLKRELIDARIANQQLKSDIESLKTLAFNFDPEEAAKI